MQELTITRQNPLIDPALHVWHAEIPLYLFLGGLVAGVMVIAGLSLWRSPEGPRSRALGLLPWSAPLLLSAGMLFLWLDLENRWNVFRFYLAFRPASPMSWGAWILLAVYPASLALAWRTTPDDLKARAARLLPPLGRITACPVVRSRRLGLVNAGLGAALGIYTGILLSALGARPLWSSALLGPLFLASGLSTGAAFLLLARLEPRERTALGRADVGFILVELLLLGLWLAGLLAAGGAARQAAGLMLGGPFTAAFWTLVVALGLLTPLAAEGLELRRGEVPGRFAAGLVLLGGLALRWILVAAGQHSSWVMAGS
jgi:formate-dependent nitrite reductase membrane component NrfD